VTKAGSLAGLAAQKSQKDQQLLLLLHVMCTNWNHRYSQEEEDDSKNGDEDGEIELKTGRRRFSTLYRKSDLAFPEMKVHCLVPNIYIHVSVSDLYIPRIGLPIFG
jgi:hypothetical protein